MKKNGSIPVQNSNTGQLVEGEGNAQSSGGEAVSMDSANETGMDSEDQYAGEEADVDDGDPDTEENPEDVSKVLTAIYPVLYLSHQYHVGDELPANDPDMLEAWINAGTAAWVPDKRKPVKARPKTAEPGLPGTTVLSEAGMGDSLVGKIP